MLKNIGIMLIMVDGLGNYAKELPRNFSQPICLIIPELLKQGTV